MLLPNYGKCVLPKDSIKKQKGLIKTMSHKKVPKKYVLNSKAENM